MERFSRFWAMGGSYRAYNLYCYMGSTKVDKRVLEEYVVGPAVHFWGFYYCRTLIGKSTP